LRTDIEIDKLVKQTYIAAGGDRLVRRRSPATAPTLHRPGLAALDGFSGERVSRTSEVQVAVRADLESLNNLADQLRAATIW
jgi:hypothetical protein